MDKHELVRRIAKQTTLTQDEAHLALDMLFGTKNGWIRGILSDALVVGESVAIAGFGTFERVERAPTLRKVPGSGQVQVPARKAVRFRASAGLLAQS